MQYIADIVPVNHVRFVIVVVFNCLPCASRSLITLVAVTLYAQLRVVILLFQSQRQSATVLVASLWQDRPRGTLFQYRYAAATFHRRSVVISKLNCSSEHAISMLATVYHAHTVV